MTFLHEPETASPIHCLIRRRPDRKPRVGEILCTLQEAISTKFEQVLDIVHTAINTGVNDLSVNNLLETISDTV